MTQLSGRIREIRKRANISQEIFAESLGVSRGHISNLETGAAIPSNQLIYLICIRYAVREEWLRHGKSPIYEKIYTPEMIRELKSQIIELECDSLIQKFMSLNDIIEDAKKALKEYEKHTLDDKFTIPIGHPKYIKLKEIIKKFEENLIELNKSISSITF